MWILPPAEPATLPMITWSASKTEVLIEKTENNRINRKGAVPERPGHLLFCFREDAARASWREEEDMKREPAGDLREKMQPEKIVCQRKCNLRTPEKRQKKRSTAKVNATRRLHLLWQLNRQKKIFSVDCHPSGLYVSISARPMRAGQKKETSCTAGLR